jgi:hypothetical protein
MLILPIAIVIRYASRLQCRSRRLGADPVACFFMPEVSFDQQGNAAIYLEDE